MIPLSTFSLAILALQKYSHQDTSPKQEHRQIGQHYGMSCPIFWRCLSLIDVRANNAVEIAPADDESHCDTAFVDAFGIIGNPDDGVGDARVDAEGTKEGAGIANTGVGSGDEHNEANHAEDRGENVAEASLFGSIGDLVS